MADSNCAEYTGNRLVGKHGVYIVGKKVGSGGNGEVYTVKVGSSDDSLANPDPYVVIILVINSNEEKEIKKRNLN